MAPSTLPDRATAERLADDYVLFGCLRFIHAAKTGPFHEHSRTLYDVSAVPEWAKVVPLLHTLHSALVSGADGRSTAGC